MGEITEGKWHKHHVKRVVGNRQFLWDYLKSHPCVSCGESNPIVLEFNHVDPSTKIAEVSFFIKRTRTKLITEIEKCEVLCANCHRKHTAIQQQWYKNIEF